MRPTGRLDGCRFFEYQSIRRERYLHAFALLKIALVAIKNVTTSHDIK